MSQSEHAVHSLEDLHLAKDSLMEVNRQLKAAETACRALVLDAVGVKDLQLKKAARRLLRTVSKMRAGPGTQVWQDLRLIEDTAMPYVKSQ